MKNTETMRINTSNFYFTADLQTLNYKHKHTINGKWNIYTLWLLLIIVLIINVILHFTLILIATPIVILIIILWY